MRRVSSDKLQIKNSIFILRKVSEDENTITFVLSNGQCGITTGSSDTTIYYSGKLYGSKGSKHGLISRETRVDMPFTCEFEKSLTLTVNDFFTPLVRKWLK